MGASDGWGSLEASSSPELSAAVVSRSVLLGLEFSSSEEVPAHGLKELYQACGDLSLGILKAKRGASIAKTAVCEQFCGLSA